MNKGISVAMPALRRMKTLPRNFREYVDEITAGITGLYGPCAAREYREKAVGSVRATIADPSVDALAIWDGADVAGMLLGVARGGIGRIRFIHVLRRYTEWGVAPRLLRESVRTFRAGGVDGIVSEFVPFCPLHLDEVYTSLGFEKVERTLMIAPLDAPGLASEGNPESCRFAAPQRQEVACTLVAAYRSHPGRRLHEEVREVAAAVEFLEVTEAGGFGATRPSFLRMVRRDGQCAGLIVGCKAAPDVGFILQVAVHPEFQGRGIGTRLIRDLAVEFGRAGLERVALGVTATNPARRLYERLGFKVLRPVDAYVWWRP